MTNQHKALAAIITCVFFWGLSFISTKIALGVFPPMTLGALRFGLAVIFLFFIKRKYAGEEKIRKEDIPLLAGAGLTGTTLYFFCENNGVSLIPASEASIITAAIPIMTLIAEKVEERIVSFRNKNTGKTPGKGSVLYRIILPGGGALISLTGVGLVAGVSFALSGTIAGYIFMLGACFSWIFYCFLTRPLFGRRSRIYIVFWQSFFGFLGFLPFALFETFGKQAPWQMPGLHVWANILFLGICCSALCYSFYAQALEALGVGAASLFLNFVPVISVLGGFFILGERLQPLQWLGAGLVLAGVYLAMSVPGKKEPKR